MFEDDLKKKGYDEKKMQLLLVTLKDFFFLLNNIEKNYT